MTTNNEMQTLSYPMPDPDMGALARAQEIAVAEIEVNDRDTSLYAQGFRQRVARRLDDLDEQRKAITRPLDEAKKRVMDLFRDPVARMQSVIDQCDRKILAYDREQERIAREEQRRLDEAAAKKRKADQEIADRAAAEGNLAKAQKFQERAETHVAPVVLTQSVKGTGVQFREQRTFEILDANKVNSAFMTPDLVAIGKVVRAMGPDAQAIVGAGVKIVVQKIIAGSRT